MAPGVALSLNVREIIIKNYQKGVRVADIARKVQRSWTTVKNIIRHFQTKKSIAATKKPGAKRKTTPRQDRKIINLATADRRITLEELGKQVRNDLGIPICDKTTKERLHDAGLFGRAARKKPLLNSRHLKHRRRWCRERQNWTTRQWAKVLWSDESKFCLFGSSGCQRVWRKPGESLKPECVVPTVKHGGGKYRTFNSFFAIRLWKL